MKPRRAVPLALLALCFLTAPGFAAQKKAPTKSDPAAELKTLEASYRTEEQKFFAPYSKAKTEAEREKVHLDWEKHPGKAFVPRFQALAKRAQGTAPGAEALLWAARLAQQSNQKAAMQNALKSLVDGYAMSPVMERAAQDIRYAGWTIGQEAAEKHLRTIAATAKLPGVKAAALFHLAAMQIEGRSGGPAAKAEARRSLEALKMTYAGTRYATQADGYLFEMDNLQVGMTAPEIEGTDQDGKPFRLSEYRGKVVVVDFWGFW